MKQATVDFYWKLATVVFDADEVQVAEMVEAINRAGFRASLPGCLMVAPRAVTFGRRPRLDG